MKIAEAKLDLMILQSKAESAFSGSTQVYEHCMGIGIPKELSIEFASLWGTTMKIGSAIVRIGKIILYHVFEFIQRNPNVAIGIAIGLALGALLNAIPLIGNLMSAFLTPILTIIFALYGVRADKTNKGEYSISGIPDAFNDIKYLANELWDLLGKIFNALKNEMIAIAI